MEHFFTCPYCWESISMIFDESEECGEYIEDCEVYCRPIEIFFRLAEDEIISFRATKMDGI